MQTPFSGDNEGRITCTKSRYRLHYNPTIKTNICLLVSGLTHEATRSCSSLLFLILSSKGVNLPELLTRGGLDPRVLLDPNFRVSLEQYEWLVSEFTRLSGDSAIGIRMGEKIWPEYFGVLGYLIMSAPTLELSISHISRFKSFIDEGTLTIDSRDGVCVLTMNWHVNPMPVFHIECSLVYLVSLFRWLTDTDMTPSRVSFTFPEPEYRETFEEALGCEVSFSQKANEIVFDQALLSLPVVWRNEAAHAQFIAEAEANFKHEIVGTRLSDQIAEFVYDNMYQGVPNASITADRFDMSVRTLHRNLKKEGTSFQQILEDMRKRIALNYLQCHSLDIKEIAFRLGYANVSAFYRAFSRWTGKTPMEYLQRLTLIG